MYTVKHVQYLAWKHEQRPACLDVSARADTRVTKLLTTTKQTTTTELFFSLKALMLSFVKKIRLLHLRSFYIKKKT